MRQLVVDLSALRRNIRTLQATMGDVPIYGVCKANGFGMGLVPFAKTLVQEGIPTLCVASIDDARILREAGISCGILLLSSTSLKSEAEEILRLGLMAAIGSRTAARVLEETANRRGETVKIHVKLDTGFGRFGFRPGEEADCAALLRECPHLQPIGVFSHFSRSFSTASTTADQLTLFLSMVQRLEAEKLTFETRHLANSCGALLHPNTRLDAVRIGSAFVGRLPMPSPVKLERLGRFECEVAELHELPKGHNVGYTNVYFTRRPTRTAVLTAGVADGIGHVRGKDAFRPIDRIRYLWHSVKGLFGNPALHCTIRGKRLPTLGRIGLTNTVVDVTDLASVEVGDLAVFDLNPLFVDSAVPRRYLDEQKPSGEVSP